jgi:tetratricopeptide (TPR) repeat protein
MPEDKELSGEALALLYLRRARGWARTRLAAQLDFADETPLTHFEQGDKPLSREHLGKLVAPLDVSPEAPDLLLWTHDLIFPEPDEEAADDPLALTPEEQRSLDRTVLVAEWSLAEDLRRTLKMWKRQRKAEAARREAEPLAETLKSASAEDRENLLTIFPEFRSWAVAERLSHDSARAAAHRVDVAEELAQLALAVARRVPGEAQRARTEGYCTGFLANVRRVATEFDKGGQVFAEMWKLWRDGEPAASLPLSESRLLDLEASLRRAQHRFPEALKRLDRALELCDGGPLATGRLLTKKANVLEQMGDHAGALAALEEATPAIESSGDSTLVFALRFNTTVNLCFLERYAAAARLLPTVREMAIEQGRQIELIRLLWLSSKLAAGQGRVAEAMAGLSQVVRDFSDLPLPYEAALAALDLAVLHLEAGRTAEVKELAEAMGGIFKAKGITREALAALSCFCEAAQQEIATVALAKRAIAELEKAQRSASPS